MAEHDEHKATTGTRRGNRRRPEASDAEPKAAGNDDEAPTVEVAGAEGAAAEAEGAENSSVEEPPRADAGGAVVPPPPPAPRDDAPPVMDTENELYPKDLLLARADRLLGVDPVVARGVLAAADDTITIADAKARIAAYLEGDVTNTDQEATR